MGKAIGLAHIGVFVSDMERSMKFYMDNLGFESQGIDDLGATKIGFLKNGGCIIELVCHETYSNPPTRGIIDHICLEVTGIEELVEELKAKGVAMENDASVGYSDKIRGGVKNIFFRGPDGERIELMEFVR